MLPTANVSLLQIRPWGNYHGFCLCFAFTLVSLSIQIQNQDCQVTPQQCQARPTTELSCAQVCQRAGGIGCSGPADKRSCAPEGTSHRQVPAVAGSCKPKKEASIVPQVPSTCAALGPDDSLAVLISFLWSLLVGVAGLIFQGGIES